MNASTMMPAATADVKIGFGSPQAERAGYLVGRRTPAGHVAAPRHGSPSAGRSATVINEDTGYGKPLRFRHIKKRLDDSRVELPCGLGTDNVSRGGVGPALAIRTVARNGVVGVHEREDPRMPGDVFSGELVWVASPVPPLVVGSDNVRGSIERRNPRQNRASQDRVAAHLHPFLFRQLVGLSQY